MVHWWSNGWWSSDGVGPWWSTALIPSIVVCDFSRLPAVFGDLLQRQRCRLAVVTMVVYFKTNGSAWGRRLALFCKIYEGRNKRWLDRAPVPRLVWWNFIVDCGGRMSAIWVKEEKRQTAKWIQCWKGSGLAQTIFLLRRARSKKCLLTVKLLKILLT